MRRITILLCLLIATSAWAVKPVLVQKSIAEKKLAADLKSAESKSDQKRAKICQKALSSILPMW